MSLNLAMRDDSDVTPSEDAAPLENTGRASMCWVAGLDAREDTQLSVVW